MTTAMVVPEPVQLRTHAVLSPWLAWDEKMRFAEQLTKTGFLPSAIKTGAQALAVILTGQELGIPPMHALRSIHVIQGKPTLSAELMLALMIKGGVKLRWVKSDANRADLLAARDTTSFTGSFTIEEAKAANLTNKDGWRNYPAAMLRARVIALTARVVAPDLIAGMYTAEELGADVDAEGAIVSAPRVVETTADTRPSGQTVRVMIDDPAAEVEPESGRQEVPVEEERAPSKDWLEALAGAKTKKAHEHLKGGLRPVWGTFSKAEQDELLAAIKTGDERWANGAA